MGCWILFVLALKSLLVNNQKICKLVVKPLIACKWPWWEYLHHGNSQVLEVVVFPPGELVVIHLSAQHWFVIPTIPGLCSWEDRTSACFHLTKHLCSCCVKSKRAQGTCWLRAWCRLMLGAAGMSPVLTGLTPWCCDMEPFCCS